MNKQLVSLDFNPDPDPNNLQPFTISLPAMAGTSSSASYSTRSSISDTENIFTDQSRQSTGLTSLVYTRSGSSSGSKDDEWQTAGIPLARFDSPDTYSGRGILEERRQQTGSSLARYESAEELNAKPVRPHATKRHLGSAKIGKTEREADAKRACKELENSGSVIRSSVFGKLCQSLITPKKKVVRAANHYYFSPLPNPISIPLKLNKRYPSSLKLQYNVAKSFMLLQSLDGAGGQHSRMYLAVHHPYKADDFKQFIALKRFEKAPGPVRLDATTPRSALRQELRVFKRLSAVNENQRKFLINTEGCVEDDAYHYFVLPLVRCDLLDVLIKSVEIDKWVYSKVWIAQLSSGLNRLHESGIIHRNLKPNNVLVDWDGSLKIADFTRAYIEGVETQPLQPGMKYAYRPRGTLEYMAPELRKMAESLAAMKENGKADPDEMVVGLKGYGREVDIWALGCIAAEILRRDDHYKVLFCSNRNYERYVNGDVRDQFGFLEQYQVHGHIAIQFIHALLKPAPAARMTLMGMKSHPFYLNSAKSFDDLLDVRLPKEKRPDFALKQDASAEPKPGSVITTIASLPQKDTPALDCLESYTWINTNGRSK